MLLHLEIAVFLFYQRNESVRGMRVENQSARATVFSVFLRSHEKPF